MILVISTFLRLENIMILGMCSFKQVPLSGANEDFYLSLNIAFQIVYQIVLFYCNAFYLAVLWELWFAEKFEKVRGLEQCGVSVVSFAWFCGFEFVSLRRKDSNCIFSKRWFCLIVMYVSDRDTDGHVHRTTTDLKPRCSIIVKCFTVFMVLQKHSCSERSSIGSWNRNRIWSVVKKRKSKLNWFMRAYLYLWSDHKFVKHYGFFKS